MPPGKIIHEFTLHRLGRVQKWVLRTEPFAQHRNLRRAYEAGFTKRTEDYNQGVTREALNIPVAKVMTVGDAWERGYADAMKQETPLPPAAP